MSEPITISASELAKCCQQEVPPLLLDVRTPAEFKSSNITGSKLVPLDQLHADAFAK